MKITIITSPFGYIPPNGYGAVEKRWYNTALHFELNGHYVTIISKKHHSKLNYSNKVKHKFVAGFNRTKSIYLDLFLDLLYSIKCMFRLPKSDILILNTFWSPILIKLFFWKSRKVVYNVARMPKGQFKFYKNIDRFFCVSTAVVKKLLEEQPDFKNRISRIGNPVDTNCFKYVERSYKDKSLKILYYGRIHPEKGLHLLVKAVNILYENRLPPELHFLGPYKIADGGGGDNYLKTLNELAKNYEIYWHEPVSDNNELMKALKNANIFCYPSLAEQGETFGVAPLEAMASGCPTIVSNLDCFKDFVQNDENALIFDHRVPEPEKLLAKKLEYLIQNTELRNKISKNGSKTALKFSVQNISELYLSEFKKMLT